MDKATEKEAVKLMQAYATLPREKQKKVFPTLVAILQSDATAYEIMYINCATMESNTYITAAENKEEAVKDFKRAVNFDLDNNLKIVYVNEL